MAKLNKQTQKKKSQQDKQSKSEKAAKKFMTERAQAKKLHTTILNPRFDYCKDYDILSICWGQKPVHISAEAELKGDIIDDGRKNKRSMKKRKADIVFDLTKDGTIIGLEIFNAKQALMGEFTA